MRFCVRGRRIALRTHFAAENVFATVINIVETAHIIRPYERRCCMGFVSTWEDGIERWDDGNNGYGGNIGPAGGPTIPAFVPPSQPGPLAHTENRESRVTPIEEEASRVSGKLQNSTCLLKARFHVISDKVGWQQRVRRAKAVLDTWQHLSHNGQGPLPTYEAYLLVKHSSDDLEALIHALFEEQTALEIAMIELAELRKQYERCTGNCLRLAAERKAAILLADCDTIEATHRGLDNLLGQEVFDPHWERFYEINCRYWE